MKRVIYLAALLMVNGAFPVASAGAAHQMHHTPFDGSHASPSITLQATHDIAVTGIQSSSASVTQGDVANIDVTVENRGAETETFDLVLRDDTDLREIHAIQITLDADQTLVIGFRWDTSSATPGAHLLSATATLLNDENASNDSRSMPSPINVLALGITLGDGTGLELPDASFGTTMLQPGITTAATPLAAVFLGRHDASHTGALARAAVGTQGTPHQSIFVANADATFQPGGVLQNPFRQGEMQGILRLEGDQSSLGAYVQVGQDTHFVKSDGSFRVMAPSGSFDILLDSPGHVPVRIRDALIDPGEVLTLPEMTLPFGDANGDGKIDILDLSMAASNFGETEIEVPPP